MFPIVTATWLAPGSHSRYDAGFRRPAAERKELPMPLAPRDVWKMLHLLYRAGGAGVPTRVIETAGFGCGPDAARILADGDAVLVDASGPAERLVLSKA